MRSTVIVTVCLAAALWSASCGNSPQNNKREAAAGRSSEIEKPAAAPEQKQPAADTRPVIVTFGDSLTQGVSGKSYPAFLQDLLDQQGYSYRVDNQGVSGDTTTDGLSRIENVVAAKPALVVLEFGGNDGLRGVPVEETRRNLEQMVRRLQEAHLQLVLAGITLPPNYGPDYVKPFTAIFPELAKQYKVRFMPFLLVNVYAQPALMQPDGIHPNEQGNSIVARDVFALIRPLLKK